MSAANLYSPPPHMPQLGLNTDLAAAITNSLQKDLEMHIASESQSAAGVKRRGGPGGGTGAGSAEKSL